MKKRQRMRGGLPVGAIVPCWSDEFMSITPILCNRSSCLTQSFCKKASIDIRVCFPFKPTNTINGVKFVYEE